MRRVEYTLLIQAHPAQAFRGPQAHVASWHGSGPAIRRVELQTPAFLPRLLTIADGNK